MSDMFEELAADMPTVWRAMFEEARETVEASRLGDFGVVEIGRTAWDALPEGEREEALDELFATYWSAVDNDERELALYEWEQPVREELRDALWRYRTAVEMQLPLRVALIDEIARLAGQMLGGEGQ